MLDKKTEARKKVVIQELKTRLKDMALKDPTSPLVDGHMLEVADHMEEAADLFDEAFEVYNSEACQKLLSDPVFIGAQALMHLSQAVEKGENLTPAEYQKLNVALTMARLARM